MDIKAIHNKLEKQCQSDFKINEIISFAYPYRRLTINATVNKSPELSIQQVYSVLLRAIEAGYNTNNELLLFLGLNKEDFILKELYFLRERGYADFVSKKWLVTEQGRKFIRDNSLLKMLEEENFEFLIDSITNEAIERSFRTYGVSLETNKLNPIINYPNRSPKLLDNKFESLSDIYKKKNGGKAFLVDYDKSNIKFDSLNKEFKDYFLIEYIPIKEKCDELMPFIEIRNDDNDFSINARLTRHLSMQYPSILYQFTNSDRSVIADLVEKQELDIDEGYRVKQVDQELPDAKTLSIWETQSQFKEALKNVDSKILIESPWIKRATLKYIDLFEEALNRNVDIIILYGIRNNDEHDYETMKKLEELSSKYTTFHLVHLPSHFERIRNYRMVGTHRKLIIKDNDYYIQGSFNFLSFNKKEGQRVANEESILLSKNVQKKWKDVFNEYGLNNKLSKIAERKSFSSNLNTRDISNKEAKQQSEKTIFSTEKKEDKIAVLEFSTKAVKFLIGPEKVLFEENGFRFKDFYRDSIFTNTGKCLDSNNIMQIDCFQRNVLSKIRRVLEEAKSRNIGTIYSIATAAFRTAENRDEILKLIFRRTGLNVRILSKKDEAFATLLAFSFTKPQNISFSQNNIIIDQGGGSTEIALFKEQELLYSYSFGLGTTMLENIFFEDLEMTINEAFENTRLLAIQIIKNELDIAKFEGLLNLSCISVGTAITRATGKQNSAKQHGVQLSVEKLEDRYNTYKDVIDQRFSNLKILRSDIDNLRKQNNDSRKVLTSALGLPLFIEILKILNINELVVSGTALWYGVFFQKLYNIE